MTVLARQDMASISVTLDARDFGSDWQVRNGGAGDVDETKTRLGGMGPLVSLGGPQTTENVVLRKTVDYDGIWNDISWLYARRGKAIANVTEQPLDKNGNAHGKRVTWTGTLKQVTLPDYDANSNDAAMIELEISTDGLVA